MPSSETSLTLPDRPPVLRTERLMLRPFSANDAADVQRLAGDRDIAATAVRMPHPYEEGMAEAWIASHDEAWSEGVAVAIAIASSDGATLLGSTGFNFALEHAKAELGYWIGKPYWGHGYATEAVREVVRWGFEDLGLFRVYAHCVKGNRASARVLEKAGLVFEGCQRKDFVRFGQRLDIDFYGALCTDPGPWTVSLPNAD